jgi:hypothetical protein
MQLIFIKPNLDHIARRSRELGLFDAGGEFARIITILERQLQLAIAYNLPIGD